MTFKEIYEQAKCEKREVPTGAQAFVMDIAALTKKSENTVRMWLSGRQKPDALTQAVLAKKFKTSANQLFPTL